MAGAARLAQRRFSIAGWARIVLRSLALLGWLMVCLPFYLVWEPFSAHNPWARRFLGGVARIMGLRIARFGHVDAKGAFLLANHISWLDIPVLSALTGSAFVAHDGLAQMPWLRWLCSLNDTVFIARHRRASVGDQIAQVREALRETGALTIFPEGTTGDGHGILPFKSALLSALSPLPQGISVRPVLIDYGRDMAKIAWVGDEPGLDNFLRVAARRRETRVAVHFLDPLDETTLADRKLIASHARSAITRALDQESRA